MFGELARRVGQPVVVGEMIAGLLLGPTFFGAVAPGDLLFGGRPLQRHARAGGVGFGWAMSARGEMGIVLGLLAWRAGVIRERLFRGLLVVLAVVTSGLAAPMLQWLLRRGRAWSFQFRKSEASRRNARSVRR